MDMAFSVVNHLQEQMTTITNAIKTDYNFNIGSFNRGGRKPPFFYSLLASYLKHKVRKTHFRFCSIFLRSQTTFYKRKARKLTFRLCQELQIASIDLLSHETRNMVLLAPKLSHLLQNIRQIKMH